MTMFVFKKYLFVKKWAGLSFWKLEYLIWQWLLNIDHQRLIGDERGRVCELSGNIQEY